MSTNFTRCFHNIELAYCSTPKVLPISILKLELSAKTCQQKTCQQRCPQLKLHQVQPHKSLYNNSDHEAKTLATVEALIKLSMDQTTYLLLYQITLFEADASMNLENLPEISRLQNVAKRMLYNYLCSKMGKIYANQLMEDFQRAICLLNDVEPLSSVKTQIQAYLKNRH